MKQIKISCGDHWVSRRVQFTVELGLNLCETWLQNELRERVNGEYSGCAASIEVTKQKVDPRAYDPRYCITFSPSSGSGNLRMNYLVKVLGIIEKDIEKARLTEHLLSGLVEQESKE